MPKPEFIYINLSRPPWKSVGDARLERIHKRCRWDTEVISDCKVGSPFSLVLNGRTTDALFIEELEEVYRS